jgi:hypothetical protein
MADLTSESGSGKSLPILWNAYISGLVQDDGSININGAIEALEQAFEQSPYLAK